MILNRILFFILPFLVTAVGYTQSFNVEQLGKAKLVNVSGGLSASSILYSGNAEREPFTYFLNGNVNINIAELYNMPFTFSYSTQKFGYTKPVGIKTFSIHPSYKWISTHIGDVSMTFSPYTLSGHLFTGFGVDLTPQGKFKVSAMYGRLLKSNEYEIARPEIIPTYKRYGYGFKTSYAFEKVNLGLIFFKATDIVSSLSNPVPFELGLTPKENVALSFDTDFKLFQKLQVQTEYANSSITEDIGNAGKAKSKGIASLFLNPNETTTSQNALKAKLTYPAGKGTLGLGYERIDPYYRTLGGYYFNNDLENITVNASQSIFKGKVNLALNLGMQKDNLENQKTAQSKRLVSSITADYKAGPKLNLNFNYSNFQSFTNSRNQFDYINQAPGTVYLDTLNFRQVNQNVKLNVNYIIKNEKDLKKSISGNFSSQKSVSQQQGKTMAGGETTFYNSALSYNMGYPEKDLSFIGSLNSTYSQIQTGKNFIIGPTIGVTKLFMDKKINTTFSGSYNTSSNNGEKQNNIVNLRLNGSYLYLKKHNFNLAISSLLAKTKTEKNNDFVASMMYSYSFDKIKLKPTQKENNNENKKGEVKNANLKQDNLLKIKSKGFNLEGTKDQIIKQMQDLQFQLKTLSETDSKKMEDLIAQTASTTEESDFKEKVLNFLEEFKKHQK